MSQLAKLKFTDWADATAQVHLHDLEGSAARATHCNTADVTFQAALVPPVPLWDQDPTPGPPDPNTGPQRDPCKIHGALDWRRLYTAPWRFVNSGFDPSGNQMARPCRTLSHDNSCGLAVSEVDSTRSVLHSWLLELGFLSSPSWNEL